MKASRLSRLAGVLLAASVAMIAFFDPSWLGGDGSTIVQAGTPLVTAGDAGAMEPAPGGIFTAGDPTDTYDHFNDPGASGRVDPLEIVARRSAEGPPDVRARLHSCAKLQLASLGHYLSSRGVSLTALGTTPPSAADLYWNGFAVLGAPQYDLREGETTFATDAAEELLLDIFLRAAPEVIANIQNAAACKLNGVGYPMFDAVTGACVYESLSCVMGRPATTADLARCNTILAAAAPNDMVDLSLKQQIAVASAMAASNECE
jgi:hypothetical protein